MMPSPLQCLSNYSFHIWSSIFLHMNCVLFAFALSVCLTPVFLSLSSFSLSLYLFLCFSLASVQLPHITGLLSQFKCVTVWQKRTVSSIYFFALLTPGCYKMQPGKAHWDAIRDTCALCTYLKLTLLIPLFLYFFLNFILRAFSPHIQKHHAHPHTHTQDCTNDYPYCLN